MWETDFTNPGGVFRQHDVYHPFSGLTFPVSPLGGGAWSPTFVDTNNDGFPDAYRLTVQNEFYVQNTAYVYAVNPGTAYAASGASSIVTTELKIESLPVGGGD